MFRSNLSLLPNIQSPTACFSVRIQACIQCLVRLLLCAGLLGWGAPRAAQAAEAPEETALSTSLFPETVSAGGFHTCALKSDGTLACWGLNDDSQARECAQSAIPWDACAGASFGAEIAPPGAGDSLAA